MKNFILFAFLMLMFSTFIVANTTTPTSNDYYLTQTVLLQYDASTPDALVDIASIEFDQNVFIKQSNYLYVLFIAYNHTNLSLQKQLIQNHIFQDNIYNNNYGLSHLYSLKTCLLVTKNTDYNKSIATTYSTLHPQYLSNKKIDYGLLIKSQGLTTNFSYRTNYKFSV